MHECLRLWQMSNDTFCVCARRFHLGMETSITPAQALRRAVVCMGSRGRVPAYPMPHLAASQLPLPKLHLNSLRSVTDRTVP